MAGFLSINKVNTQIITVTGKSTLSGAVTASSGISLPGTQALGFGSDQTKAPNAGSIGYQLLTPNALDVVGGGSTAGSRLLQLSDNIAVTNNASVAGSLSVNGNSTLASATCGTLSVSGQATLGGTLSVNAAATFKGTIAATSTVSGFPISSAYNANAAMVNARVWVATATVTSGQATFYPTSTNASGGTPLFTTILSIQSNTVLKTTLGAQVPCTSVYSQTTASVVINAVTASLGTSAPNGTTVFCMIIGL